VDDKGLVRAILAESPPDLATLMGGRAAPALAAAISKGLAKRREDRYATVEAFSAALLAAEPRAAHSDTGRLASAAVPETRRSAPSPDIPFARDQAAIVVPATRVAAHQPEIPETRVSARSPDIPETRASPALEVPPTRVSTVRDDVAAAVEDATPTRGRASSPQSERKSFDGSLPLGGRYVLRRNHADSAHGRLYETYDVDEGRTVALKILLGKGSIPPDDWKRYLRGIEALRRVVHPRYEIVRVLGEGSFGIVCEAVDETLGRHVAP
jgi:hypothetical protein